MPLVHLDKLRRYYGGNLAFAADTVTIPEGAIGLLGPNGAGKSTLLQMLLGLLPPSSGRIEVLGMDVAARPNDVRLRAGYVSENDALVPGLKSFEFVALAGELAGMGRLEALRRAHEVLDFLGVEGSRFQNVEGLSAGLRRRVQVAQALVHDPELLILDEPTNGLDPSGRRAMLELITKLVRDFGKSVILSSHLLEDVDRVCDFVIILHRGRVLEHGRIEFLRSHHRNRYRLRVSGNWARYRDELATAGVTLGEAVPCGPDETELLAVAPDGFSPQEFFSAVRQVDSESSSGVTLLSLRPDYENLADLFRRVFDNSDPLEPAGLGPST